MKISLSILIGGLSGGGAERVACNLANYLCNNGYTVEIVTMSDDTPTYQLDACVKRCILLRKEERKDFFHNCWVRWSRLKKYVKSSDTQGYLVMLPITTAFLLALHKYIRVPIIVAERNDPARTPKLIWALLTRLFKYANGFVFQTQDAQNYYAPYLKSKPSLVIPNAINPAFIRDVHTENRKKQIVAIGRFTKQKNFMLLLRAFATIHKEFPQYQLTIYGQGEQRATLEHFIIEHNLEGAVSLPGYVKDIPQQLLEPSVFVLSSDYEGMPNALMEAMASGLACISTDCPCGGPRFLIKEGENGLLVPVGDQTALENALRRVLADDTLRQKLGANATRIQRKLSSEIIYKKWEEFIELVIEKNIRSLNQHPHNVSE